MNLKVILLIDIPGAVQRCAQGQTDAARLEDWSKSLIAPNFGTHCLGSKSINLYFNHFKYVIRRMPETDDHQKAMIDCTIGTQPLIPAVYGVNAPL